MIMTAGYLNGSISHFNKDNFNLIITFTGHATGFSTNVVKKIVDNSLIQNLFPTINTNTSSTEKTTSSLRHQV